MSRFHDLRRQAIALVTAIFLGVAGALPSFDSASATTATGLSLSIISDDTSTAASDSSTTNGFVPVTGGQLTYRWGWTNVPGGGNVTFSQTLPVGVTWNTASIAAGCAVSGSFLASGETLTCTISGLADIPGTTDKTATVRNLTGGTLISSTLRSGVNESSAATVTTIATSSPRIQIARGGSSYLTDAKDPATGLVSGLQVPFSFALFVAGHATERFKGQEHFGSSATFSFPITVPSGAQVISCGTSSAYQNDGSHSTLPSFGTGASTATNRAANSGTMSCTQSGTTVTVTFTGVDARLNHIPSSHSGFFPSKGIFALGGMYLWMAGSNFNTVSNTNVTVDVPAANFTTAGSLTRVTTATSVAFPVRLAPFALNQTSASVSTSTPTLGAAYAQTTQLSVPSGSGQSATNAQLCQVWDNSLQRIRADTTQPAFSGVNIPNLLLSNFTVEYGTNVYADDTARRAAECGTVGDGAAGWFSTISAAGGPAEVSAVRIRYNRPLDPGQFLNINVNVSAPTSASIEPNLNSPSGTTFLQFFNNRKSDQTAVQRLTSGHSARATASTAMVRNTVNFVATNVKPGATAQVTLTPTITTGNAAVTDTRYAVGVTQTVTLPNGCFTFVPGTPAPISVTTLGTPAAGADCSTVTGQTIVWNLGDQPTNGAMEPITFAVNLNPATPTPVVATITAVIASNSDKSGTGSRTHTDTINVNTVNQFQVSLTSSSTNVNTGIPFTYRVGWKNASTSDIAGAAWIVDVLPYEGDARGTTGLGGLQVSVASVSPAGVTVQYTTDDPDDVVAALAGDLSGSTNITWSSTNPGSGVTAIRARTQSLVAGAAGFVDVSVTPIAFAKGGVMVNDITAKADSLLSGFNGVEDLSLESSSSTISGFAYQDTDYSGDKNVGDTAISAKVITLTGFNFGPNGINNSGTGDDIAVNQTTTTDTDGSYSFTVSPGRYLTSASSTNVAGGITSPLVHFPETAFEVSGAVTVSGKNFGYQEPINPPVAIDDSVDSDSSLSIFQGESVDIDVTSNDTTYVPAGVPPTTITAVTDPARGTVALNNDGTITYTANSLWPGSVTTLSYTSTFTYTLTNPQGTSTATVTVVVKRLPVAATDSAEVADEGTVTIDVTNNDIGNQVVLDASMTPTTDGDGSVTVVGGDIVFTAGEHNWTPGVMSYLESISYRIVDADGNVSTGTAGVTVYRAPLTDPDVALTAFETPITVAVTTNDEIGKGPGTVSVVAQPSDGTATVSGQSIVYQPDADFSGTDTVTYSLTDALGQSTTATVTVTVADDFFVTNDGSLVSPLRVPQSGDTFDVLANDNGTTISIDSTTQPTNGSVAADGLSVTYTPDSGFSGTDSFTYTVTDIMGTTKTATVYVDVIAAPLAQGDSNWVNTLSAVTLDVIANDVVDGIGTLAITTAPSIGSATVSSGQIVFTAGANVGDVSFEYSVTDDVGQSDTATVTVTVVEILDPVNDGSSGAPIDIPEAGERFAVLDNDGGTGLTVTAVSTPAFGTAVIDGAELVYTPIAGFFGPDSFTYTVTDAADQSATATVFVNVIQPPTAVDDSSWMFPNETRQFDVLANDTVPATGSISILSGPDPSMGTATVSGSSIEVVSTGGLGDITVTYRVTDSVGQTSDGTLTVSVTDTFTAFDDGSLAVPIIVPEVGRLIDVVANDAGTDISVTDVNSPSHGTATIEAGEIRYVPNAGYSGTDSFSYVVTNILNETATATVFVRVYAEPQVINDSGWATTSTATTFTVLSNDTSGTLASKTVISQPSSGVASFVGDSIRFVPSTTTGTITIGYRLTDIAGQSADGTLTVLVVAPFVANSDGSAGSRIAVPQRATDIDVLANDSGTGLTIESVSAPTRGTATAVDDVIVYTPNAGASGNDSFTYTISDATGRDATATVTLRVVPVPVARADAATTDSTSPVTVDVLGNDTFDGTVSVTVTAQPVDGTATVVGNAIRFQPQSDFDGVATMAYRVTDRFGQSATSTVRVTVTAEFVARNDGSLASPIRVPAEGAVIAVLDNDSGDGLVITDIAAGPANGAAEITGETITFTPSPGAVGPDSFTYVIEDTNGAESDATVFVVVMPAAVVDDEETDTEVEPTPTPTPTPTRILLNLFDEVYENGKTLTIEKGQVIQFTIPDPVSGEDAHTVTVTGVGPDYADVVIRSEPIRDRLSVTEVKDYDVNRDGTDDVRIRLDSVSRDAATMTFTLLEKPDNSGLVVTIAVTALTILGGVGGALYLVVARRRQRTSR